MKRPKDKENQNKLESPHKDLEMLRCQLNKKGECLTKLKMGDNSNLIPKVDSR